MRTFVYKAWDENYKIVKGKIEEDDIEAVRDKLRGRGLKIINISRSKTFKDIRFGGTKLKDFELAAFCEQMGAIMDSGVNLLKGLEVLQTQANTGKMRRVLSIMYESVKKGKSLTYAMIDTEAFPELLCDMVGTGELSGNMETIFYNMETLYDREAKIKDKIRTASIYPLILLCVVIGMLFFFNFFVFSELKELFKDSSSLPGITRALISSIQFVNSNFIQIIGVLFMLILLFNYLFSLEKVRYVFSRIALSIPIMGRVRRDIIVSRFTRSMALFLKSSVPVLKILENTKKVIGNAYLSGRMDSVRDSLINGSTVAEAFSEAGIFDPIVIQMVMVGEETGNLDESLEKVADIYDKRAQSGISRLTAMVEPMFTLLVGLFVGILLIAMAMPVMEMANSFK